MKHKNPCSIIQQDICSSYGFIGGGENTMHQGLKFLV